VVSYRVISYLIQVQIERLLHKFTLSSFVGQGNTDKESLSLVKCQVNNVM